MRLGRRSARDVARRNIRVLARLRRSPRAPWWRRGCASHAYSITRAGQKALASIGHGIGQFQFGPFYPHHSVGGLDQLRGVVMPLVFVHGVATRRNPDYERGVAARNALFRRYVNPALGWGHQVDPFNAYWGGDAAEFRWHHASLPQEDVEAFGAAEQVEEFLLAEASEGRDVNSAAPVSAVASRSVEDAVDLIWASAAHDVDDPDDADSLAALAHYASAQMSELRSDPSLTGAVNDEEWLDALATRLEGWELISEPDNESFGGSQVWDRLSESMIRLRGAAGRIGGQAAAKLLRAQLHRHAALFLGDVFTYLDQRGQQDQPGPIVAGVVKTLEEATEAGQPLVVVAHSMGGQIVYDVLSFYRPDIQVHKLITVGSQVGLFEELCLLQKGKAGGCPDGPVLVPELDNVGEWINVFDRNDLFGFATGRIFAQSRDFEYSTGKGLLAAHSSYFTMPSFFRRLADRTQGLT